jgi:hypothetical protein
MYQVYVIRFLLIEGIIARFLGIARRVAVEAQSLLSTTFDIEYLNETQVKEHYEQARKTRASIGGFKRPLKK